MVIRLTGWLGPLALCLLFTGTETISKNFVNSSMPEMRPTFVINFDMATIICQHSENPADLHLHEMSVLCDGKQDCYSNPAMHDESFPYCEKRCNSTCSNRGACLYDGDTSRCFCNSGFAGPMCEIVDENKCLDKPCHWLASCQDTVGGYKCQCLPGFRGDGHTCADIDECSEGIASCPYHADCVNLPGTSFCNCTAGYAPMGTPVERCADINECETGVHKCESYQMCQNTEGSFTCVDRCSPGYEYLNNECVDIDECRLERACDSHAECTNTPGGHTCACEPGWTGDGRTCSPTTDCSKQENICDRHAKCLNPLKLCICQAGYAGDGITCNDVNECEANENPCENQKGSRCVNIQGGYICCGGDVDDDRCIQDQGAFCAGGCGLHAVCYNQTCRCMEGFIGDPLNKCIDVNECESDKMCTGVGQWCINKIGGHICCGPDSLEKECNQAQLTSDGEIETANALARGEEFVERGGQSKSSSGGTIVTNQGRGALPGAGGADNGPLACTSYCPGYSECLEGFCKCSKGYFGNPVNGCEDIDECATGTPCPISRDEWCVNTLGGYHCCSVTSNQTDCIGLEIGPSGIKLTGTAESTEFPVVSSSINESIAGGEILSEETHQVKKFEAGKIILTKEKQPSKVEIFDTKPDSGEVGLEITRDEKGLNTTSEDLIVNPEVQGRTTLKLLEATTALPGVVSTLNGASEFTTSIPITEIPIHSPDSSTQAPINNVTNTLIVEIDKNGRPIATSSSSLSSSTPTGSTSASSSTSAGPSPTGSSSTSTTDEATGSTGAGPTPTGLTPTGSTSSSSSSVSGSTESRSTFTSSSGSSVSIQSGSTKNGEKTTSAGVPEPTGATGGSTASGSGNSGTMAEGPAPTGASSTTGPGATDTTLGGASPSTSGSKTEGPTPTGASATTTTGTSSLNPSGGPSTTGSSKTETPTPTSASSTTTGGSTSSLTTSVGPNGEKITTESGGSSNTTSGGSITTSSGGPTPTGLSPTGSEGSPSEAGATLGSTEAPEKHAVESNTSEGTAKPLVAELAKPTSVEDEDLILGATKSSSTPSSTPSASTEFTTKEGHINIRITTAEETATTASESTKTSGAPEATSEIKNPLDGFPEGTVIHEEGSNGTKSSGSSFTAPNAPKIPGLEREPTSIIDTEGPGVHGTKDEGTGKPEGPNGPGKTGLGKAAKPGRQGPDEKGDGKAKTPKEGTESTAAPGNTDKGETGPTSSSKTSPSGSKGSDSGETPSGQSTTEGPTSEGSPSGGTTLAPDGSEPTVQTFGSRNESSGGRVEIRTGTFAPTHPSSTGDDSSEGTTVTSSGTSGTSPTSSEVPGATDAPDELWTGKPLGTTTTDNSVPDEGELGLEIKHVGQTGAPAPEFTTSGPSETPESKGTTDNPDTVIDGDNPNGSVENGEKPPKGKTEEGGIKPTEPGTTKGEKGESTTGTTGNTVTGTTPAKVTPASGEMGLEIIHHGTTTTPKATTPEEGLEITGGFPTTPELGLEISGHTTSSPPPKNETDSATHAPKPKEEKGGEKTHEKGTEGEDKPDVIKDSEEETENKGGEHKPTGKPDIDLRSGEDPDSVGKDNKGNKKTTITSSAEVINSSPRPGDKDSEEGSEGTHAPTKEVTATTTTPSLSTAAATIIPQESTVSPTSGSTEGVTSPTLTTPESTAAPTGTTVSGSSTGPKDPSSGTTVQNRKPDLNSTTETPLEVTTLEETSAPLTATLPTKDTFSLPGSTTSLPEIASPANKTKCTSSDECGNDAYCERRTGGCRCYPGFAGMPPHNKCEDVDECADGLHNCHETARCHNYVGGYSCFCPMGFRKVDGGKCEDINECSESGNGCCSLNATCINKEGSYGCSCKEGFTGDGYNCLPITSRPCMESEWNASGCGSHHLCLISSNGKTDCSMCKMGFKMVDGTCTDVNECVEPGLNMCSKNADCNNILGTYTCTCKKGYKGDGYMCEDEDECRLSPCHPLADCTNSPGSYNCSCPEGFKGDGFKLCQNPNELACENVEDFCGRSKHTACLSVRIFDQTLTSVCECEPNYRFNQKTKQCEDIDECAENRHNCDPASAICVNEDGGFRCDCAEGYEGMGGVCVDVDECERGVAGCHSMAMCINQPGSCGCKCMKGMTGDGIQCSNLTSTTTPDTRVIDNSCTAEWQRVCRLENKTCHVDEEDVPQCGSCIEGHQPSNGSCQPLQEKGNCADPKKNNCDPNAECIDVNPGRHFCTCRVGYIGDGMRCDDIDECSVGSICDVHADCHNTNGSFQCICWEGYTGTGFKCTLVQKQNNTRPNCHLDSRLCDANATCNKNGSCICNQGFEGDGIKACNAIASTSSAPTAPPTSATSPSTTATKGKSTTVKQDRHITTDPPSEVSTKSPDTTTSSDATKTLSTSSTQSVVTKPTADSNAVTSSVTQPTSTTSSIESSTESSTASGTETSNGVNTIELTTTTSVVSNNKITTTTITVKPTSSSTNKVETTTVSSSSTSGSSSTSTESSAHSLSTTTQPITPTASETEPATSPVSPKSSKSTTQHLEASSVTPSKAPESTTTSTVSFSTESEDTRTSASSSTSESTSTTVKPSTTEGSSSVSTSSTTSTSTENNSSTGPSTAKVSESTTLSPSSTVSTTTVSEVSEQTSNTVNVITTTATGPVNSKSTTKSSSSTGSPAEITTEANTATTTIGTFPTLAPDLAVEGSSKTSVTTTEVPESSTSTTLEFSTASSEATTESITVPAAETTTGSLITSRPIVIQTEAPTSTVTSTTVLPSTESSEVKVTSSISPPTETSKPGKISESTATTIGSTSTSEASSTSFIPLTSTEQPPASSKVTQLPSTTTTKKDQTNSSTSTTIEPGSSTSQSSTSESTPEATSTAATSSGNKITKATIVPTDSSTVTSAPSSTAPESESETTITSSSTVSSTSSTTTESQTIATSSEAKATTSPTPKPTFASSTVEATTAPLSPSTSTSTTSEATSSSTSKSITSETTSPSTSESTEATITESTTPEVPVTESTSTPISSPTSTSSSVTAEPITLTTLIPTSAPTSSVTTTIIPRTEKPFEVTQDLIIDLRTSTSGSPTSPSVSSTSSSSSSSSSSSASPTPLPTAIITEIDERETVQMMTGEGEMPSTDTQHESTSTSSPTGPASSVAPTQTSSPTTGSTITRISLTTLPTTLTTTTVLSSTFKHMGTKPDWGTTPTSETESLTTLPTISTTPNTVTTETSSTTSYSSTSTEPTVTSITNSNLPTSSTTSSLPTSTTQAISSTTTILPTTSNSSTTTSATTIQPPPTNTLSYSASMTLSTGTAGPPSIAPPSLTTSAEEPSPASEVYTGGSSPSTESETTKFSTPASTTPSTTVSTTVSTTTKEESTTAPTTTTQTAFATSPTPLATEVPIDEDLVINKPADPSPPLGAGKCSPQDRSNCHELAICEASTGTCRCKNGFTGNGHSVCKPIPATDCVVDATLCTGSATCDHHTRKCVCPMGFIGDGFLCSPDPQDCVIRKDLCSTDALCAGRRCQCNPGFTGDGIKCVSLHQRSSNCSECDDNAHCNGGMCECNIGYFGNGLCCVPDPRDCVHFPGICHPEASCDTAKRSCQCSSGHLGDGISCFPTSSCRSNPSICHPDAICLPTGTCLCQHGYEGNGNSCTKVTPHHRAVLQDVPSACGNRCDTLSQLCIEGSCVCKHGFSLKEDAKCHDINECDANPCHHLATCANLPGSYLCSCPDGYAGDGKSCIEHIKIGQLAVFCEPDGMTLLLGNDTESFEGRMFVRGQAENPHCSKTFSTLSQHDKPYTFKVPFEHCNVRLENHDTFATTVIVQKHPMFITTNADSFDLRCTYPTGVKEVVSHVNVSELNTSSVLTDEGAGPLCKLTVTNEHEENINSATVGESLTLKLEVSPNDTYSILPRNCFAINIETGERYSLTDRAGCAIDDQLFPEWTRIRPSLTQALFRTFKWPDSSMIRFQCDCSACVGDCPVIDCAKRRDAAMRRFRFRRVRHTQNGTEAADRIEDAADYEDESEDRLLQKLVDPKRLAFSSLMTIHEDVEETRAQQQLEHWRTGMSKESDVIAEAARDASVCVRTILIIMSVALVCLCIGLILVLCIRYIQASRRAQYQKDTLSVTSSAPVSIIGY